MPSPKDAVDTTDSGNLDSSQLGWSSGDLFSGEGEDDERRCAQPLELPAVPGGFYSWYSIKDRNYPYLYSEITGYGITTLLFLHKLNNDDTLIEKAKQAADWIIESAMHECGGVGTRLYKDNNLSDEAYSFEGEHIFSFDTGMVLYGMTNLYKSTEDERYLEDLFVPGLRRAGDFRMAGALAAPGWLFIHNTADRFDVHWIENAYRTVHAEDRLRIQRGKAKTDEILGWLTA